MKTSPSPTGRPLRFLLPAILFVILCIVFLVVLGVVQYEGSLNPFNDDGTVTRTVTVAGQRGQIYDCNGRLLVGNVKTYDLVFEYGAMADTRKEVNEALLAIMDALRTTGNEDKLAPDLFPLEGEYPNMTLSSVLNQKSSEEYAAFATILFSHGLSADTATVEDVLDYFTGRYSLHTSAYTNEQITDLIRILYEMERVGFGVYQSYTIARDVNISAITAIEEAGIEGATFLTSTRRVYQYPGIASHILGRVGKITAEDAEYYDELGYAMDAVVGVDGVEKQFESWLRGQDGTMVLRYDEYGNLIEKYYETEPKSGNDVYLTIDIELQIAAEEALAENVDSISTAKGGAVSVLDPNSYAVLAMASYPTYDLTLFGDEDYVSSLLSDTRSPFLNRALNGAYAPGSTYKMGVALAALETGGISANTCFTCKGTYTNYGQSWGCTHVDGTINVTTAIQNSCNVFFYNILDNVFHDDDISVVTDYTTRLGLGSPTGIELPEKVGTVAGPAFSEAQNALWTKGNDISAAIGQSDHSYSPLQLSVYTATLANGGTRYSAHLLDSVRAFYTGEKLYDYGPATILDQVNISPAVHSLLMDAMGRVVTENASVRTRFSKLSVTVGGKTGTAEYTGKVDYALFTGFAPLDSPEIVATCIIEEGQHGYLASETVAAVFEKYFEIKARQNQ